MSLQQFIQSINQNSYYDGSVDTDPNIQASPENSLIINPQRNSLLSGKDQVSKVDQTNFQNSLMEKQTAIGEQSTVRKQQPSYVGRNQDAIRNANYSSENPGPGVNFDDSLMTSNGETQMNNSQFLNKLGKSIDQSRDGTQNVSKFMMLNSDYQEQPNQPMFVGGGQG